MNERQTRKYSSRVHASLGAFMALFVLVVVGLVIAQTWFDWRDAKRNWVIPEWAKGMALAGAIAASLTAAASYASSSLVESGAHPAIVFNAPPFWPDLGFMLCGMPVIGVSVRKKRLLLILVI